MLSEISQAQEDQFVRGHLCEAPTLVEFMETESRPVVTKVWVGEKGGELLFNRYRVSVWDDGKFWNGWWWWFHNKLWVYLMPLKWWVVNFMWCTCYESDTHTQDISGSGRKWECISPAFWFQGCLGKTRFACGQLLMDDPARYLVRDSPSGELCSGETGTKPGLTHSAFSMIISKPGDRNLLWGRSESLCIFIWT